jgi:hydroxymethylglutaryl-CoA synthase
LLTCIQMCDLRHDAHLQKDFVPKGDSSTIAPSTYFLEKVDDKFRREYSIKA